MFNDSFLRVCRILRFVKKIRFFLLESGRTKPWCPSLVSRPSAKAQEPLARSRGQWQEVEGLLFSPQNSQLLHILSFHSQAVVSLFIFPTGQIALDSEHRGRRYAKNTGHTGTVFIQWPSIVLPVWRCIMFNDSYLRACMKLWIVQKIRFCLLESGRTKAWCPGLVFRPSAKAQEPVARSKGLVIQPKNSQLVHILSFHSQGVVS